MRKIVLGSFAASLIWVCTSCNNTNTNAQDKGKGSKTDEKEVANTSPSGYDLTKPILIKLPLELDEISGVAYYAKDTSVFAIQDENGLLYKIYLNHPQDIQKWNYARGADFEDVVLVNETFFVLTSNGDITGVKFPSEDSLQKSTFKFPFGDGNEFEILYYDAAIQKLRLICKDCDADKKSFLTSYIFDPVTHQYSEDSRQINVTKIAELMGKNKVKFKPSAAAINPITKELYIVSAINKAIVVVDNNSGSPVALHHTNKEFKQPEGITFTPGGTMIISNEAADIGVANIMVFPYENKNDSLQ